MKRAHKYRFNPTPDQDEQLVRTFGCAGLVYSKALEERTRAYALEGRRVFYAESSAALTAWKRSGAYDSLPEVSSVPRLQVLQHLRAAFASFFAKRAGYPAFRSRKESAGVGGVHPPGHPAARPPDDGRGGPAAQAATSAVTTTRAASAAGRRILWLAAGAAAGLGSLDTVAIARASTRGAAGMAAARNAPAAPAGAASPATR
ncbi:transposase [Nonomuraea sp. NPDC049625]|uniref:transposase n=1 Tax=Nonomuraea sp. NPDC049625 TaxID=3155775 RepID=UPI0034146E40